MVSGKEGCSEVGRGEESVLTAPTPLRRPLARSLCFPISLLPPRLYLSLPQSPLIQPAGPLSLQPHVGLRFLVTGNWSHHLRAHAWLPTGNPQKAEQKHVALLDGPRAPSPANNSCGCKSRKQQTQLRTPGARSPGTALGVQCPMKKSSEVTREHPSYLGDATAYLLFSKPCYSSRTCSFDNGLPSWAPPHFLTLSPLNIVQSPAFPAGLHVSLFQEVYQDCPASALLAHRRTPVYLLHTY